nr:hypothetical protein CFP56_73759 [Quercus suber]
MVHGSMWLLTGVLGHIAVQPTEHDITVVLELFGRTTLHHQLAQLGAHGQSLLPFHGIAVFLAGALGACADGGESEMRMEGQEEDEALADATGGAQYAWEMGRMLNSREAEGKSHLSYHHPYLIGQWLEDLTLELHCIIFRCDFASTLILRHPVDKHLIIYNSTIDIMVRPVFVAIIGAAGIGSKVFFVPTLPPPHQSERAVRRSDGFLLPMKAIFRMTRSSPRSTLRPSLSSRFPSPMSTSPPRRVEQF